MITAFLELNHRLAAVAALSAFPPGLVKRLCVSIISRTVRLLVPLATAGPANLASAATAFAVLAAAFTTNVVGPNQLTAVPRWAIYAVPGGILKEFPVPLSLEAGIKHPLDVF